MASVDLNIKVPSKIMVVKYPHKPMTSDHVTSAKVVFKPFMGMSEKSERIPALPIIPVLTP